MTIKLHDLELSNIGDLTHITAQISLYIWDNNSISSKSDNSKNVPFLMSYF